MNVLRGSLAHSTRAVLCNAHGPNAYLHLPTGKKLTCCVASVIASHFSR